MEKINAQNTSTIRTLDLMFLPGTNSQNIQKNNEPNDDDDLMDCLLTVKIEKIDSVNKIQFLLGTKIDPNETLTVTGNVVNINGQKFIQYNGNNFPFTNYTCSIRTKISKVSYNKIKLVTFYLTDILNRKSPELYFNIN